MIEFNCGIHAAILRVPEDLLAIYDMTMAECQTVTVTTVVVTVTVVMVVEVVVKSTRSTTSPLWGIETSVMGSKMFKQIQT